MSVLNPTRTMLEEHRQRDLATWTQSSELRLKVAELWKARMEAIAPEPTIVHVETQRPPDYVDLLNTLDMPSLAALVVSKLGKELEAFKPLLSHLNGHSAPDVGAPLNPPISLLAQASAKPRKMRVLIIGPLQSQFREIQEKTTDLPVELQFLDKDKNITNVPISTDFVIVTKFTSHSMHDAMKRAVPPGKFFYLEGGITAVVQKLRDLGSLLPPRA